MTTIYNMNLIDWLTGNYQVEEQPTDYETFYNENKKNISGFLTEMGSDTKILNGVQITSPNGNNSTWVVLLLWNNTTLRGGLLLLDENFQPQALLTQFESGDYIGRIDNIQVDESGRIYALEIRPTEQRIRFVYLSNFLVKIGNEYKLDIRKAYNMPIDWNTVSTLYNYGTTYLYKIPQVSKYCVIVKYSRDDPTYADGYDMYSIELSVENGNTFKTGRIVAPSQNVMYKPLVSWNSNNIFTITATTFLGYGQTTNTLAKFTIVEKEQYSDNSWFSHTLQWITLNSNIIVPKDSDMYNIDSNTILIVNVKYDSDLFFSKITISGNTGTITNVKDYYFDYDLTNVQVKFAESNGYLYCYYCVAKPNLWFEEAVIHIMNKTNSMAASDFNKYVIYNNQYDEYPNYFGTSLFFVQNNFNLYKYYTGHLISSTPAYYEFTIVNEIYNENNYNGPGYVGYNSLIGNQCTLDNSYGIVYARNLYNKVINDNKTTYSSLVPNNMFNDNPITNINLDSETKYTINSENKQIEKNVYEELIINFINYINIINQDTQTSFKNGASRLNDSVSQTKDYSNAKMTKYKINYTDNTSLIGNLTITKTDYTTATITFQIEPTKEVKNIEFISNDELSVYNIITGNFEAGSRYNISQDVRIGD